ncbi:CDC27 family protein [Planctomycetota bacterium]|nr:CDC27 family protein [Planctomycetota bacterium]
MKISLSIAAIVLCLVGCTSNSSSNDSINQPENAGNSACTTPCATPDPVDPDKADLNAYAKAYEFYKAEEYKKAIERAERAIELGTNQDAACELIGLANFQLGDWQKALDGFSEVSQHCTDEQLFRVRWWMAQCMFRLDNYQGTLDVLDELAGHRELAHYELNLRAYALIELERNDEAIVDIQKAIELAPEGKDKEDYKAVLKRLQE